MQKEPFKWDPNRPISVPQEQLPVYRTQNAITRGVERRLIFKTWGGIGDQICAEPTLRHALRMFKDCEISLASELPELFAHLRFKRVFDLKEELPNYNKYLVFETITAPDQSNLVWQFFSHLLVNCVDFPSMCALRSQLPIKEKEIHMLGLEPEREIADLISTNSTLVHAGKHWQSKTFPKQFWDRVLYGLRARGITPILIGADSDDNRSTVDVDSTGCLDLRNKLSIMESIWVCQKAKVLLTNDSSPLHMAASSNPLYPDMGKTWIGYIATCKHPDMITHWRNGQWQWREQNFGKSGIWDVIDYCPNKANQVEVESIPQDLMDSWLPDPIEMADWAAEKVNAKN